MKPLLIALLLICIIGKPLMTKEELKKEESKLKKRKAQIKAVGETREKARKAKKLLISRFQRYKHTADFNGKERKPLKEEKQALANDKRRWEAATRGYYSIMKDYLAVKEEYIKDEADRVKKETDDLKKKKTEATYKNDVKILRRFKVDFDIVKNKFGAHLPKDDKPAKINNKIKPKEANVGSNNVDLGFVDEVFVFMFFASLSFGLVCYFYYSQVKVHSTPDVLITLL